MNILLENQDGIFPLLQIYRKTGDDGYAWLSDKVDD